MFPKKNLFYSLLFTVIILQNSQPVFAEIIFQDNFDNSPDWQSQQTVHKSQPEGMDISWGSTRSDTCTTHCPPQGWTAYRAASSLWTDDRLKDTFVLDTEGARGGSGKGITYNVELGGTDDTDNYGAWTGGGLNIWLGEEGYDNLYIRVYMKWGPGWTWRNAETNPTHGLFKAIVATSYNCDGGIFKDDCINGQSQICNPVARFPSSGGCAWPLSTFLTWHNANDNDETTTPQIAIRRSPDYDAKDGPENWTNKDLPVDNNWHCYEFNIKMNSAIGVADGEVRLYVDGVLHNERTNVEWQMAGTDANEDAHGWNWLFILDNINNSAAEIADKQELQIYMDDLIVSTEYIGTGEPVPQVIQLSPPTF